ncbi:hypothetical protein A1O3_03628 [Capronia epimyces CBS 606.96]|uniref:H/ACA ribonucleoprotein complex non-core subunit NAF1 n=1 Tax=Capronia epimyces CBS 606.96 TaxID=1182542 RepID=W9YAI9_9EURO|nr:uncharacterized protein A1O3_03628 [Capronia epimyces CBS 606.96]EXJ86675.1 hypothetical protein A1O3_03628 [Capronia epimyces CBS 606.96]
MDGEDEFPTSPAKRQRTNSPEESRDAGQPLESQPAPAPAPVPDGRPVDPQQPDVEPGTVDVGRENPEAGTATTDPEATVPSHESTSLLDALMLQVEAASASAPPPTEPSLTADLTVAEDGATTNVVLDELVVEKSEDGAQNPDTQQWETVQQQLPTESQPAAETVQMDLADGIVNSDTGGRDIEDHDPAAVSLDTNATGLAVGNVSDTSVVAADVMMDVIPGTESLAPEPGAEGAEWEIDSSPYESSSDSDSDSSSDTTSSEEDSDDDADGDYAMLDPEETARILMQGDAGSDDEGGRTRDKTDAVLRTAHEQMEAVIPKPDITVTEDMKIEELGNVEIVVENTVVIKAKTSGEYQVLETGSLICLQDRSVVGVVADLIGRVEEPRYTIRFNNDDEIKEAGLSSTGATVFYVPQHSTFVFTQPLKGVKGSDASNFHDEEVGEDEMEFSDDEAEAEYKRQMKARRQGRSLETGRGRGGSKHSRGSHRGGGRGGNHSHMNNADAGAYGNGSLEMNYDDVADGGDEGYTPLQRPANLTELLTRGEQPQESRPNTSLPPLPPPPRSGRGDYGGRGRGYGRGGRGGPRGQHGGGSFGQSRGAAAFHNHGGHNGNAQNGFPQQISMPNLNLPTTPAITPQNMPYPPMTPSPITPLPHGSFNFNGFNPPANFPFVPQSMPMPGFPQQFGFNFQQQQQQYQQRWAVPPPQQQQQQQHPHQQQQNQGHQQSMGAPPNFSSGPWASNPALAAALQKQAEDERRRQGA